jgi:hypothetical protein
MPFLPRITSVWRTLFHGSSLDGELDDEPRAYLEASVAKKVRAGMDPAAARREAAIEMGGADLVKEAVRSGRIVSGLETTLRDVRYAWRASPGRALVLGEGLKLAAVGLALGVPAAAVGARLLEAQLFGVTPRDLVSYAAAVSLLAAAAVVASWSAAQRATAANPLGVLRAE